MLSALSALCYFAIILSELKLESEGNPGKNLVCLNLKKMSRWLETIISTSGFRTGSWTPILPCLNRNCSSECEETDPNNVFLLEFRES